MTAASEGELAWLEERKASAASSDGNTCAQKKPLWMTAAKWSCWMTAASEGELAWLVLWFRRLNGGRNKVSVRVAPQRFWMPNSMVEGWPIVLE